MGFKLAELFVDLKARDEGLRAQVSGVKDQLSAFGVAVGTAVGHLAASAIARASAALSGFISKGIAGASNLGETLSKVEAIFGPAAASITTQADAMAKAFGLPKQAILDAAGSIGLVGKASGQSQAQAAAMANTMAKLAADASSFYNVPLETALEKIRSGLVGESEPLRAFGVLLSEDAVANEALALGLAKSRKELDEQAKVAARASLIQKGLADASGDLERTAGSTANQWRKFTGTMENLAVSIGTSLSPAIQAIVEGAASMATAVANWFESTKGSFEAFAQSVVAAIRGIPDAWDTFVAGLAVVFLRVEEFGQNFMAVMRTVPENLSRIGHYIAGNWRTLIVDALSAVDTAFNNFAGNLWELGKAIVAFLKDPTKGFHFNWTPLLDGFKATSEELPELLKPQLVSMQGAIDAVGEDLNRKITDRAKAAAAAVKEAQKPAKAAAAGAAKKTADFKSEVSGVSEFALKLRASIYEHQDDIPKKQLEEQRRTQQHTKKIAEVLTRDGLVARLA